jgi:N-acetyltransferase
MSFPHKTIDGQNLLLVPYNIDHIDGLKRVAFEKKIWDYLPYKVYSDDDFERYIGLIDDRMGKGTQLFFTIIDKHTSEIFGSTSFLNIDETNKKLEIGGTWLTSKVWGTKVNLEVKYLLLTFCFSEIKIERIEFRTRENNIRSQKAIEKIGGVKEGILRSDRINEDGTFRNTILYSILRPEWKMLKVKLISDLNNPSK